MSSLIRIDHDNPNSTKHEDIPNTAGIYGWYYNFKTLKGINDIDILSNMLAEISINLRHVDIQTTGKSHLSTFFTGNLTEKYLLDPMKIREKIEIIESNSNTEELITLLNEFSPPVYIGISVNLKTRYNTHLKDLQYCDIVASKRCFGQRARERSIRKEYLTYKYLSMPSIDSSSQKSVEYILNRIFKPIFGRK